MKVLVMAFDGETRLEKPEFKELADAWQYADDLGSKWFFYPFTFIVSDSGQTIKDAPKPFEAFRGKRVKSVSEIFKYVSDLPNMAGVEADDFAEYVSDYVSTNKA